MNETTRDGHISGGVAAGHTPGPWRVGFADETEEEALLYESVEILQVTDKLIPYTVAEVPIHGFSEMPEDGATPEGRALADARLIAAAPDLLDALRKLVASYPGSADKHVDGCWCDLHVARAAIARATPTE